LFKAGEAQALVEAVEAALSAKGRWAEIRREGRRFVERERNWAASIARHASAYGALVSRAH
jgi:glycosyltransferase involved in cell wall biosynthesis